MHPTKKKATILIIISVITVAIGQLLLKYGLNQLPLNFQEQLLESFLLVIQSTWVWAGLILFIASSLLWILGLSKADLSYSYPLLSIGYAAVAIASWLLFNENLGILRIVGIVIIAIGVIMLAES